MLGVSFPYICAMRCLKKRLLSHFLFLFCPLTRFDSFFSIFAVILAYSIETMLYANEKGVVMMIIEVTRHIDELGRVTIPSEIRRTYSLKKNDVVEIVGTDEGILLRVPGIKVIKEQVRFPDDKGKR